LVDADNAYAESENARVSIAFHAQPKVAARLPTVQDVACLAKVSVGSVSSVLIRPDTLHRKAASRDLSNRAAVEP